MSKTWNDGVHAATVVGRNRRKERRTRRTESKKRYDVVGMYMVRCR